MSVGLAWLWAACLLMLRAVFLLCWRISMVCLALELVGPWSGKFPGEGHGNPLQYSCLENPMDRGPWRATVHRVAPSTPGRREGLWACYWEGPSELPCAYSPIIKTGLTACVLTQSCTTLCDPLDCSPPGSSVHGILQARILEWVIREPLVRRPLPLRQTQRSPEGPRHLHRIPRLSEALPRPGRGAGTLLPSAQRFVWAARQPLGNAALGALFA